MQKLYDGVVVNGVKEFTVGEWMNKWLEEYKRPFIRLNTYDGYRDAVNRACKHIGYIRLTRLKTEHIQEMYNDLKKNGRRNADGENKGLSSAMVRKVHLVLHSSLEYAIREKKISSNPSIYTRLPRNDTKERRVMQDDDMERFMEAIEDMPYWRDVFYLELMTGLRRGEICGLMWSDFDEYDGTLQIQRSVSYKHGKLRVGETKTDEGTRMIVLPDSAFDMLLERRENAVTKWIFPRQDNPELPMHPNGLNQKLGTILERLGIPKISFHELRHTFATYAAKNGVDPKTLASILGHTNASFTLDTYTHVTGDMQRSASKVVGRFLDDMFGDELTETEGMVL
ncbi:MAG: site-specific integrase [Clostridia bacterium]|nr:site-specific integrase [Clostridia bacterium]